ncbi:LytTR family DNA-binding domain-containing protein [Fulvivirga maritima]|uniref:LytR/AlgR family response regulator transcription factor n=1 Tax=Fulvivirga maritima TaxID=2904247 RepID=UPI001F328A9B|nr:LytTR family DNA-binding domain-containing protein [Fulvivirga maritima]UII26484.1 LytTR family DNA-binding domain-containing protein [Fulvivirga maritima]
MKVVIIEDERPAARRLEKLLQIYNDGIEVLEKIPSVKNAIAWLSNNQEPLDLVFMDIQLADGLSFEIFDHVEVPAPVIFTTAYDEYALKAFKVNSIDYLLKPIDIEELTAAIEKWESMTQKSFDERAMVKQISEAMGMLQTNYKSRFIVKVGEHIKSIAIGDIQYFFSREKATFCHATDGRNYLLDHPLEKIEEMLDPQKFYRVNRKYIISMNAFDDIISYSNSRLKVNLKDCDDEVIVSRDRVGDFKKWLDN